MRKIFTILALMLPMLSLHTPSAHAATLEYSTAAGSGCYITVSGGPGYGCKQGSALNPEGVFVGVHDYKADGKSVAVYWKHTNGRFGLCRLTSGAGTDGRCTGVPQSGTYTVTKVGTCDATATISCKKPSHYDWFMG